MTSARAQPAANAWVWPDPQEVTAPPVRAGRPVRSDGPAAVQWPSDLPDRFWPPASEVEHGAPTASSVEDDDDLVPERPLAVVDPGIGRPAQGAGGWGGYAFQSSASIAGDIVHRTGQGTPSPQPQAQASAAWSATVAPAVPAGAAPFRDPSPSRFAYRLHRLWLTPMIRNFLRFGLPLLLVAAFAGGWVSKAENRALIGGAVSAAVARVQNQPMFQVRSIEVLSRSPEVAQGVEQLLGLGFPVSSWDLDLSALRARAETLDAVEGAWLQVRSGGVLEVRIAERVPAMIWRNGDELNLVDAQGHRVALLATRSARADLPLIAGEGAPAAIAEAGALWAAAQPIQPRIRGLVRVGQRRWDVVLDRDQRILLPETGAVEALERVVALSEGAQQLLSRDLSIVDMRHPARPTLRLTAAALAEMARNRTATRGAPRR
ncbi:MAG: cell division protein FtsQ/DivIB [Rhodobacteraceae bacterium]|nr:cell division protein FtsQ/DivIB [Paracoccaceae bacterium]